MIIEHFRLLAGFNRWANEGLYEAVATLPEAEYRKTRPCAYFGSIHGTLNHLLVVDLLWFGRIQGAAPQIEGLDQVLYEDFAELRAARGEEDDSIVELLEGFEDADLTRDCHFTLLAKPGEWVMKPRLILTTVFNHQTHHRGQVHAMLSEAGVEPPGLDVIAYPAALE